MIELALAVFPFLMIYAVVSDILTMRIANRVSIILVAGFVAAALLVGLAPATIAAHLGVGALCLCVTFLLFTAGWIGGGDAKLTAATAVWFGPSALLLNYFLIAAVFGGVLTLALLMARQIMVPATGVEFVDRLLRRDTGIPYGVALGTAGLVTFGDSFWMGWSVWFGG